MNRLLLLCIAILILPSRINANDLVHIEFPGLAILGSVNYEFNILDKSNYKICQNVGFGSDLALQLSSTLLLFKDSKHLEAGISTKIWLTCNNDTPVPFVALNIGYRYQKTFMFRIVPQIVYCFPYKDMGIFEGFSGKLLPWISFGFGYTFKRPFSS